MPRFLPWWSRRLESPSTLVTVFSMLLLGLAGGAQAAGPAPHAAQNSACSAIVSAWGSSLNLTYFQEACSEPSFQATFAQEGLANFSIASSGGPGWSDDYYVFAWVGACTNSSLVQYGPRCSLQEYWTVNLTTDQLSGPTVQEGPLNCACPASLPPPPSEVLLYLVVLAGSAAVAAVALLGARRYRRLPPPPTLPARDRS